MNEKKKKILLITTGGTIASVNTDAGLVPAGSEILQNEILRAYYDIEVCDLMRLDSSNIQPEEWVKIAHCVFEHRTGADGIVITHGTDTMAYTSSILSFMLRNIDIPVVLTGAQLPMQNPISDAFDNLRTAFLMAASGRAGVFVAFDRQVMLGCRAVKVRAESFDAFESVNRRYAARVTTGGLVVDEEVLPHAHGVPALCDRVSTDVFLIKLTPGLSPRVFDALCEMGYRGIGGGVRRGRHALCAPRPRGENPRAGRAGYLSRHLQSVSVRQQQPASVRGGQKTAGCRRHPGL